MATTPATTFQPLVSAKETLLGMTRSLEQRFPITPRNDVQTSLNSRFNVFPRAPVNDPKVAYFCWGVGGRVNDSTNLSSAQFVLGTNMAPYAIRPFRAVPFATDLSAPERAQYAMRTVQMVNGVPYCFYYLKKIVFAQSQVQYIRTDPISGLETSYEIDYTTLEPTPPTAGSNGVITDVADSISVVVPGALTMTGQEVLESANVVDGGDQRYAVVSELGFVSASTEAVTVNDVNGLAFSYQEAIMAQMTDQYDWVGQPYVSTTDSNTRTINFSMRNLIVS